MRTERIFLPGEDESAYLDLYIADPTPPFVRKAVLVIPGGGYSMVCSDREGEPIAQAFMPYGYNAFVLHYHTKREHPFPLQLIQATKAIKQIKDHAEEYNVDPEALFIAGGSAGGHLAASTGILWKHPAIYEAIDMPYGYNKPKGVMLLYPVISGRFHAVSFHHLLCTKEPTEEQLNAVSLERHVDGDSAPAFLLHSSNDPVVDVRNSLALANAYTEAGLQYELHIYPDAPHGVALANRITECGKPRFVNAPMSEWVRMAAVWADSL